MSDTPAKSTPRPSSLSGPAYLSALARFIKQHESALATYYAPRPKQRQVATAPSWTTVLSLGILPGPEVPLSPSSPPPRKDPLVLNFDPHHLYYLLLKFDELGIAGLGDLDVKVEGGTSRPMMVDYSAVPASTGNGASLFRGTPGAGMLGLAKGDDARSVRSGMSSFTFGSGWWGLGGKEPPQEDEATNIRYIYSSCTKLPALKLAPFRLVSSVPGGKDTVPALQKAVDGFEDCPPDATCVPVLAFKNLQSLVLEDLDPRGFLGWNILSVQLRSLEVYRGGVEDIGELICDAPCEDWERRTQEERRNKPVGTMRRRRTEGASESSLAVPSVTAGDSDARAASTTSAYPTPPRLAWSSLRHLSLSDNSLTFIPSAPLIFLPTLTSLDLSSNLLISIPTGLAHLTSLRALNLRDNMIDSLLGISQAIGAVEVLNLSGNRIDILSGLDRLPALIRLDVRDNHVHEALEISRLATLPHLREVWVAGNPFTKRWEEGGEENWRAKCFGYFLEEEAHGHRDASVGEIWIDGAVISSSEKKLVEADFRRRGTPLGRRRASAGVAERVAESWNGQTKVVGRRVVTTPHRAHPPARPASPPPPLPNAPTSATTPDAAQPHKSPVKSKRRKPRRIVDLDADPSHPEPTHPSIQVHTSDSDSLPSSGAERTRALAAGSFSPANSLRITTSSSPSKRREQVSLSAFNEPSSPESGGEAFRKRIEALRDEVGESWLSVLGEREARAESKRKELEEQRKNGVAESTSVPTLVTSTPKPEQAKEVAVVAPMPVKHDEAPVGSAMSPAAAAPPVVARLENDAKTPAQEDTKDIDAANEWLVVKSVRKKKGKGKKKGGR
ncbi:leucine rich repeat domain containing protein [Rhodotorula toruloides]|uniref:Leucine rich repeat domain containing protein n=1 Tax=Rhodotorula toruloides TaxID=5286 RepID=A0A511KC30_RHOTO|nr:leucine rich repeat domain containing protein [Rhodotorula toruloides]